MTQRDNELKKLSELEDINLPADETDIRGMQVEQNNGKTIGKVGDLIIDPEKKKVRYLSIDLDESAFEEIRYQRTLIPIGVAGYGENKKNIVIDDMGTEAMKKLPDTEKKELTRDLEKALSKAFDPDFDLDKTEGLDFYERKLFDMGKFYPERKKEGKDRFGRFPPHQ